MKGRPAQGALIKTKHGERRRLLKIGGSCNRITSMWSQGLNAGVRRQVGGLGHNTESLAQLPDY